MSILDKINKTGDIRKIQPEQYDKLAAEIRDFLVRKVSEHGGHLASNLGAVELTMALHLAYNPSRDKIIWDVGHQSYTHKILTGRKDGFDTLREFGGMSGFPKRRESDTDVYETGHATTSISAALGMAKARDLKKENYRVVAVIGDGSMTGGMAFEALNNVSGLNSNLVIVLNDNNMSISLSAGSLRKHLTNIRVTKGYNDLKQDVADALAKLPKGDFWIKQIKRIKSNIKHVITGESIFDTLGVTYVGPIEGHDVAGMANVLRQVSSLNHPVLVHVVTKKGQGYKPALRRPDLFHGVSKFDPATGKPLSKGRLSYTDVFSRAICRLAKKQPEIVCVTAAMSEGVGLERFKKKYPERFFDVGIAEEHAVTFAAGMASEGLRPVVCIYSSFLQRAYDQIMMDVCMQRLPVIFAIDRAGLVGADGETHQGAFDLSYLSHMPGLTVIAPSSAEELEAALIFAGEYTGGPVAIRYPKGEAERTGEKAVGYAYGTGRVVTEGKDIAILSVGSMLSSAKDIFHILREKGYEPTLCDVRFVKPLDTELLDRLAENHKLIVTYEDNAIIGGYGEMIDVYMLESHFGVSVLNIGIPDQFVPHGDVGSLRKKLGMDPETVAERIIEEYSAKRAL